MGSTFRYASNEPIPGPYSDDQHKAWIEVLAYSHSISQPASVTSAGGRTAAQCRRKRIFASSSPWTALPPAGIYGSNGKALNEVKLELATTPPGRYSCCTSSST